MGKSLLRVFEGKPGVFYKVKKWKKEEFVGASRGIFTWKQNYRVLSSSSEKAMAPHSSTLAWKIPWGLSRVGCPALLQGVFLTQGLNLRLLHCRQTTAEPLGKSLFSSGSSQELTSIKITRRALLGLIPEALTNVCTWAQYLHFYKVPR